ncbi:MAG: hypothetical protein AB1486_30335 [Planctomycetota bacterium]
MPPEAAPRRPELRHHEAMGWEGALDRLVLQQIDNAARGVARPEEVRDLVNELLQLAPERARSYYHLGLAGVLLDASLFEHRPQEFDPALRRWFTFGRLMALARRRAHARVVEMLHTPECIELLEEPEIARTVVPIVLRTAFEDGDLDLVVTALEKLVGGRGEHHDAFREALAEILRRVERSRDRADEEALKSLLVRCRDLPSFASMPGDVRAPIHRAIGRILQHSGEWEQARQEFSNCLRITGEGHTLASVLHFDLAACYLEVRGVPDLEPDPDREDSSEAIRHLDMATADPRFASFNAYFARGVLRYEKEDFAHAASDFERALDKIQSYRNPLPVTLARIRYYLAVSLFGSGREEDYPKAARLIDQAIERVSPDLADFHRVHDKLHATDREVALRFLDAIDVGREESGSQLLGLAREYLDLGEPERALKTADRAVALPAATDERVDALKLKLRATTILGSREAAHDAFLDLREHLLSHGRFQELERILRDEGESGLALDHFTRQGELNDVLQLMEGRTPDRVEAMLSLARHLRGDNDALSAALAVALLEEAAVYSPERVSSDLEEARKLAEHLRVVPLTDSVARELADRARRLLGHDPRLVVIGGNEAQRRKLDSFEEFKDHLGIEAEWWFADAAHPQRPLDLVKERLRGSRVDGVILLQWNRLDTAVPTRHLCRSHKVACRQLTYVGFMSLKMAIADLLEKIIKQCSQVHGTAGA